MNGRRIDGMLGGNGWLLLGPLKGLSLIQRSAARQDQSKTEHYPCIAYAHSLKELKATIQNLLRSIGMLTLEAFSTVRQGPFLRPVERMTSYIPD